MSALTRAALVLVLALTAGCGAVTEPEVTGRGLKPVSETHTAPEKISGAPLTTAEGETTGELHAPAAVEPFPGQRPPAVYANTMRLDVSVLPRCGTPGTTMRAVITTEPNVILGIATEYASAATPDMPGAPVYSDPRGRFEWAWVIRPDTPRGPAYLKVAAGRSGVGEAAAEVPFMVAEAC